jgi:DNA-binding XRE family transcriptional regulator
MRALAVILNIAIHHISRVESAQINTSIMMAYSIAKVFELSVSELFNFEPESVNQSLAP